MVYSFESVSSPYENFFMCKIVWEKTVVLEINGIILQTLKATMKEGLVVICDKKLRRGHRTIF